MQPIVITTAFSDKPKNDISTNLLSKPANMPCAAVPNDHDPVIGPYGLPHSNAAGETLTDMTRNCSLQVSATYFKHCSYETFYDFRNNRTPRQLDLIFVHQKHGMHVTNAGVFQPRNNVVSDHHATRLKLHLVRNLTKNKNKHISTQDASNTPLVEDPINWSLLHCDKLKHQEFADHIETILFKYTACESHQATPMQLSEAIMYAAESTITEAKSPTTNWFDASKSVVRPLRDTAQRAYKRFLADGTDANKHHWHATHRHYYRVQRQAKKRYFNQLAIQASKHAMRSGPK
jgi:hypothetical protein